MRSPSLGLFMFAFIQIKSKIWTFAPTVVLVQFSLFLKTSHSLKITRTIELSEDECLL